MARRPFSTSPGYLQYIRGLRELHALTLAGRYESPEADAIRDGMDHPWYDLSETEQARLKGLSADLYSISDPPKEFQPPNPQVRRNLNEANEARQAGNWDQALEILRRWSRYIPAASLSSLRGSLWDEAGDHATAALFYEHAAQLDPTDGNRKSLYLSCVNRFDQGLASILAEHIIANDEADPPEAVIGAASIALETTKYDRAGDSRPTIARLIPVLERALARLQGTKADRPATFVSFYVLARVTLGRCHDLTGDSRAAIRALDSAIEADPNNPNLISYRGSLRYGVETGAVEDFEKAIQLGTPVYGPYFFLAHRWFVEGRFADCLTMSEWALTFSTSNEVHAVLNEWLGICRAELGYPADQVRSAFEEALRLAPDSDRLRDNLSKFEEFLANPGGSKPDWLKPRASMVQAIGRSDFQLPLPLNPIAA